MQQLNISYHDPTRIEDAKIFLKIISQNDGDILEFSPTLAHAMKNVWLDEGELFIYVRLSLK